MNLTKSSVSRPKLLRWLALTSGLAALAVFLTVVYLRVARDTEKYGGFEKESLRLTEAIASRSGELDKVETTYNRELAVYSVKLRDFEQKNEILNATLTSTKKEATAYEQRREQQSRIVTLQEVELEKGKDMLAEVQQQHADSIKQLEAERAENQRLVKRTADIRTQNADLIPFYEEVMVDNDELIVQNRLMIDRVKRKSLVDSLSRKKAATEEDVAKFEQALANAEEAQRKADSASKTTGISLAPKQ